MVRKVSSSVSKSKPKENFYKFNGSIEHYKRINTLTVFVKRNDKETDEDLAIYKDIKKYCENKAEKLQPRSRKANDTTKKPSVTKESEKSTNGIKRRSNLEVVKVYSSKHNLKKTSTESVRDTTSKPSKGKHENKLTCGKMTSITTKPASNHICSKDHKSREKVYAEKFMLKLKRTTARIPATRKCIYTFMDPENIITDSKVTADECNDESKKCKSTESKRKPTLTFLKYQENYLSPTDLQISEIDKQLKDIRSQKKKINQLIYKELKNTKSSWQEVKDKADLLNVKNIVDRNDISRVNELCQILENTTKQVYSLHHSLTDLGNQKHGRSLISKQTNNKNQNSIGSKDDNDVRLLEKDNKSLERDIRKTLNNYSLNIGNGYAGSDGAREMFLQTNTAPNARNHLINIEENDMSYKLGGDSLMENHNFNKTKSTKIIDTMKQNCEVSSQADANTSTSFIQKYPVLKKMLPEVLKSEFLKKSCCFE